ncbi:MULTISPECIES: 2-hydroxyacid dehydrogenase [Sporomusa]|uniref:2-hydroxyacid dehydrogenase n=1 Tax=Sporomusa TaxID=2375 RepID=UPI00166B3AAE|nr:2-hydroxyacid dehydrogenase [Sporomusa sp. GT1]
MAIIVMLYPKSRLEAAKIELPADMTFRFLESYSHEAIIEACRGADCLLLPAMVASLPEAVLNQLSDIKLIQCPGAGFDHIDLEATARIGIPVANAPGQNLASVAEFTIGLIIALQRQIIVSDHNIKSGNYQVFREQLLNQGITEIGGSRVGLIGLGAIGYQTARLLHMLNASVSYYAKSRKSPEVEESLHIEYRSFEELLAASDVVSIHVPLTAETREMLGRRELGLMKHGSLLINTARGEIINQADLAESLENGHLGGAAIDTLYPEPPKADHPLLNLSLAAKNRLLLTPHVAGVTVGAFRRMMSVAFENMKCAAQGKSINHVVNGINRLGGHRTSSEGL